MKACLQLQPEFCSREKLLNYFNSFSSFSQSVAFERYGKNLGLKWVVILRLLRTMNWWFNSCFLKPMSHLTCPIGSILLSMTNARHTPMYGCTLFTLCYFSAQDSLIKDSIWYNDLKICFPLSSAGYLFIKYLGKRSIFTSSLQCPAVVPKPCNKVCPIYRWMKWGFYHYVACI